MPVTLPTADDAQALHDFVQARNEEEWQKALADHGLSDEAAETVRRLTNSHKMTLAGTTAYLLHTLAQGQFEQAERLWDYLTSCGEQWQDHPEWNPAWANPARARLHRENRGKENDR